MPDVETKKKKLDYTNSAENLVNPPEIGEKLKELKEVQEKISIFEDTLSQLSTYQSLKNQEKIASDLTAQIKGMIDVQGSYQDTEQGWYAVKYRRISKSYDAGPFIENYPKYSPAVIVNSVNVKALEGLIKGGLLIEEELKKNGVLQMFVGYAYVVKVG